MEKAIQSFVQDRSSKLQDIFTKMNKAYWDFTTTGSTEQEQKLMEYKQEIAQFLANQDDYAKLKEFRQIEINEEMLARQVEVLYNIYLRNQMDPETIEQIVKLETEISGLFTNFRANLNGKRLSNNEILDILHHSTNSEERKAVWTSSKQIGLEIAPILAKLVEVRNKAARKLGFANFYSLALAMDELDEKELFQVLDRLKTLTDAPFRRAKERVDRELAKKFGLNPGELMPWHYSDPFFQEVPASDEVDIERFFKDKDIVELSKQYYTGIGLDVADIIGQSDLYEREGKDQHAYCTHIDGNGDVRVLCNVRNTSYWTNTMLHELGHAVYDKYVDYSLPYTLRQPAHMFTTEGIAMMFGRLATDTNWLNEIAGIERAEVDRLKDYLYWQEQLAILIFIRWGLVMVYFERELYNNPEQDLNTLWWNLVQEFQLLQKPENLHGSEWASKIHLGIVPVYYQNYILGYLAAYQFEAAVKNSLHIYSMVNNQAIGAFLTEKIFKPGAKYHWNVMIEKATGHRLTPDFAARVFE